MSQYFSHFNTARQIIAAYKGEMPLAAWLKNFFATDKKYGSRDRKTIGSLCYNYYRLGNSLPNADVDTRLKAGVFVGSPVPNHLLQQLHAEWNTLTDLPPAEKLKMAGGDVNAIFNWNNHLSAEVDVEAFNRQFLIQPGLFIRVRPGSMLQVKAALQAAAINYDEMSGDCLRFENGTRLDGIIKLNESYVVQDYSSQQTGDMFGLLPAAAGSSVWDCCAASGGKAILAYDRLKNLQLTVSDVRPSIIHQLQKRLGEANIRKYQSFVADVTSKQALAAALGSKRFDLVICDAPCSGSGTWSRTPEQLKHFKTAEIDRYSQLQQQIFTHVLSYVKPGGHILYITCSLFKQENEDVVSAMLKKEKLQLKQMKLYPGWHYRADSMFAALFQKT